MTDTTTGRYVVARRWGRSWVLHDLATNPPRELGPYPTQADAQADADRRNTPTPPPQRTHQPALFDHQET